MLLPMMMMLLLLLLLVLILNSPSSQNLALLRLRDLSFTAAITWERHHVRQRCLSLSSSTSGSGG